MSEGEGGLLDRVRKVFGQKEKPEEQPSQNGPTSLDVIAFLRRARARHRLPPSTPPALQPPQPK